MDITLGSLFDGIGGFPLAGIRNDITTLWGSEIESFPIKVTKIRFPNMKHLGDITKIGGAGTEPVDIITFGSPCQDLSVAGKRAGLAGERSGLFMEAIRIIREMREHESRIGRADKHIRPRFAVWENVPGAFSSNKGEDFRAVLEETARVADETITIPRPAKDKWSTAGCVMGNGWSIAWRVLDAKYWGVPQRRRRIFLVADFGGQSAPEVLFKREGLSRHLAEGRKEGQGAATDVERSIDKTSLLYESHPNDSRVTGPCKISPTISSRFGTGGNNTPLVQDVIGIDIYNFTETGDMAATLNASSGNSSTHSGPSVMQNTYCIQGNCIDRADTAGCNGKGWTEDVCYTLNTIDRPAVTQKIDCSPQGISGTISSKWAKGTGGPAGDEHYNLVTEPYQKTVGTLCAADCKGMQAQMAKQDKYILGQHYTVRRLTPLECERLQDYPDFYTDIEKASDSGRYKALGNSVAVCCPEYVLEGIKEVLSVGISDSQMYKAAGDAWTVS